MPFDIDKLVRENIKRLVPYSSARDEFDAEAKIFLDANENSFGSDHHRYPDPHQRRIKEAVAELNGTDARGIFVGNGSDEAIDLLFRIFCRPQVDNVIVCQPTYGMYEVTAAVNDVAVKRTALTDRFELDPAAVARSIDGNTKLIFVCSPNNPTGNLIKRDSILELAAQFSGIVVVDEAYIQFAAEPSLMAEIERFPNLVVLQTFSKAWGLAGLRVGLAFAGPDIISLFDKTKSPYNVSQVAQDLVLDALKSSKFVANAVEEIVAQRDKLADGLARLDCVQTVHPSEANFLFVKTNGAEAIYRFLLDEGIVVRDRSKLRGCEGHLRITVGTAEENQALLNALEKYEKGAVH